MADLIVRLYSLPSILGETQFAAEGIRFLRPLTPDREKVVSFVRETFDGQWASECETSFFHFPVTMWVAAQGSKIVGFACYEATGRAFFGPTGVDPAYRKRGIGRILLLKCLYGLQELGYSYAIIGGTGEEILPFYQNACGAVPIPDSTPGIYQNLLKDSL